MLFGFSSNQDFADSTRIIAFAGGGGLGLPDRDYYTKTDPKSVETRAKYLEHVRADARTDVDDSPTRRSRAQRR